MAIVIKSGKHEQNFCKWPIVINVTGLSSNKVMLCMSSKAGNASAVPLILQFHGCIWTSWCSSWSFAPYKKKYWLTIKVRSIDWIIIFILMYCQLIIIIIIIKCEELCGWQALCAVKTFNPKPTGLHKSSACQQECNHIEECSNLI